MNELVPNPFDGALATLLKDFPAKFSLEVEAHVFQDLPSMADARQLGDAMENMKTRAAGMGYVVTTTLEKATERWVYAFKLRPGFVKPRPDTEIRTALPPAPPSA